MTSILQSVYTHLSGRSPKLCDAIYPDYLPQEHPHPALVLSLDSDRDIQLLDGGQSSLHEALIAIDCYDTSLLVALALAVRVKAALIGYVGGMGDHTVRMIYKESESSAPETATGLRGVSLQFFVGYQ